MAGIAFVVLLICVMVSARLVERRFGLGYARVVRASIFVVIALMAVGL